MLGINTAYIADMEVRNECLYNMQLNSSHQYKTSEQCQQQMYQCNVKLPELEIPVFDGDKMKWREFWDFFKVTVDQNKWLSEIEKYCYLKSKLTGEASQAISGLSMSNENFKIAKTLLIERFEDTQFVIHRHYTDLISLTPATNNAKGLRIIYDKIESNMRSLEALKQDINHDIFVSIISSKIPKDVFIQMELQKGSRNKWSVNKLQELLHNYVCATERAEELSHSKETKHETESSSIVINGRNLRTPQQNIRRKLFVQCRYCDGNHWSDQCLEYSTIWDRKQKLNGSCFRCLKKGHIAYECFINNSCFHCGRKNHHSRSLCPLKFASNEETLLAEHEKQPIEGECQITEIKKECKNEPAKNLSIGIKHIQSKTTQVPKQEVSTGREVEHMSIMSEEYCDPKRKEINRSIDELTVEIAELQLKHKELSSRLLSMDERKFNVQQQNKNLEKELSEVSALTKFNHKLHQSKCQSRCVAPPWNFKVAQDSTKNMLHFMLHINVVKTLKL